MIWLISERDSKHESKEHMNGQVDPSNIQKFLKA